jgi:ABC-type multidrug transport system fused ATPase/permease subunit
LVAYFAYALSLFQPVREIADKWNLFLSGVASAERIFSILDWDIEIDIQRVDQPAKAIPNLKGHLVFEKVWFAYEGDNWALRDFSLELLPGERVGIVGYTGAGKSTLISLLMRFYEPQRGRILLDGKELKSYDKRELRASIGLVQQDVFLFSGSFEDNISFWQKSGEKGDRSIFEALQSMGWATGREINPEDFLRERGSNFSAGQRQAIAFARVLAANPAIWILDEATANMDSETEIQLQQTLEKVSSQKTTLLIAHRLATIQKADRILVLNKGLLVESGNHESLMRQGGLYSKLYRLQ